MACFGTEAEGIASNASGKLLPLSSALGSAPYWISNLSTRRLASTNFLYPGSADT
jgi:hypothetical protein